MVSRSHILLIGNESEFANMILRSLIFEGYSVSVAHSAHAGKLSILINRPDLVLLEVLLPDMAGMELCQKLRQAGNETPILMLSTLDDGSNCITGLNAGADGYLSKPFALDELSARIRALLRRCGSMGAAKLLTFADIVLFLDQRIVKRGESIVPLIGREFELLRFLFSNPNQVFTRSQLLEQVWGYDSQVESNVVDVYMYHLRNKLGTPSVIETIHNVGYILRKTAM